MMQALMRQRTFWIGLGVGLLVGLFFAWIVWPVQYVNAYPSDLEENARLDYLLLVSREYQRTGDLEALGRRLSTFDKDTLPDLLAKALERYGNNPEYAEALNFTRQIIVLSQEGAPATGPEPPDQAGQGGARLVKVVYILLIILGGALILYAGLRGYTWFQERSIARRTVTAPGEEAMIAGDDDVYLEEEEEEPATSVIAPTFVPAEEEEEEEEEPLPETAPSTRPPLRVVEAPALREVTVFRPVYMLQAQGDEGYDDVFTIYDEREENLGECGVGEAETLHDQPGRPTVMEVWLFDKQDTITHQAFILSPWAYEQADIRQRYADQGTVIVARAGNTLRLTARTLYLEAEIKDVAFAQLGEGNEVFSKLALEIKVYQRITSPSAA